MGYRQTFLKGVILGNKKGTTIGVIKRDTRNLVIHTRPDFWVQRLTWIAQCEVATLGLAGSHDELFQGLFPGRGASYPTIPCQYPMKGRLCGLQNLTTHPGIEKSVGQDVGTATVS